MLIFLHVFVDAKSIDKVTSELTKLPYVVDVYEVTGEYDVIATVKVNDIGEFRKLLKDEVLRIPGVRSVISSVVLYTHKKDGVPQ